jgi:hypothetical protein
MLPANGPLRRLAQAAAAAGVLLAAASLPWRGARPPAEPVVESSARCSGALRAGAAAVPLDPPDGAPVAGFPRLRWRSVGVRDPVQARALVLSSGGCRVALVSVDLLLVPGALERKVASRLDDLGLSGIVLAATHTHAGPGGYWDNVVGELAATGPFDRATFDRFAERIAEAVRRAAAAEVPAGIAVARASAEDLVGNRDGDEIDGRIAAARVEAAGGRRLAEIVVFPAHATLLGGANRRLSGDWPALLTDDVPGVRLFFQGAVGDQSAHLPGGGETAPVYGRAVRARVDALSFPPADPAPAVGFAAASVALPPVAPAIVPAPLRPAARNLLGGALPARAVVRAVRLGPLLLVAVPGEPVAAVGARWRQEVGGGAEIVSVAGDYLGYVELPSRVEDGTGEAPRTYYEADLALRLGAAAVAAGRAADAAPSPAGAAETSAGAATGRTASP